MPDFVAGPVSRRKKNKVKHLVMWKSKIFDDGSICPEKILVFPGGMEHPAEHGDLEATYREELEEETGLKLRKEAPIKRLPVSAEHGDHTKYFVQVWRRDCDGRLYTQPSKDGKTHLSRPFFANKEFLEKHLHGDYRLTLPYLE